MNICCPGLQHPYSLLGITVPGFAFREMFPFHYLLAGSTQNQSGQARTIRSHSAESQGERYLVKMAAAESPLWWHPRRQSMNSSILSFPVLHLLPHSTCCPVFFPWRVFWGERYSCRNYRIYHTQKKNLYATLSVQCLPHFTFTDEELENEQKQYIYHHTVRFHF